MEVDAEQQTASGMAHCGNGRGDSGGIKGDSDSISGDTGRERELRSLEQALGVTGLGPGAAALGGEEDTVYGTAMDDADAPPFVAPLASPLASVDSDVMAGAELLTGALRGAVPPGTAHSAFALSQATTVSSRRDETGTVPPLARASRKRPRGDSAVAATRLDSKVVRMLYVQDPEKGGVKVKVAEDGTYRRFVTCRICGNDYSFNKGSYTAATNHLGLHRLFTEAQVQEAVAWADKADAEGLPFPLDKLPQEVPVAVAGRHGDGAGPSTSGAGALSQQVAMMHRFVRPKEFTRNTVAWKRVVTAVTKWIAADSLPFSVVESEAFREFARHLEPRFPAFTRKAVVSEVRHCASHIMLFPSLAFLFRMQTNERTLCAVDPSFARECSGQAPA